MVGDKGFDSDETREASLDDHDALPVIPNPVDRREPWPFDEEIRETYEQRSQVERSYNKAKLFRQFATRQEKLGELFLGFVRLALGFIHVKQIDRSVNTPCRESLLHVRYGGDILFLIIFLGMNRTGPGLPSSPTWSCNSGYALRLEDFAPSIRVGLSAGFG